MAEIVKLHSGNDWVFDLQAFDVPALGADPNAALPPFDLSGCTLYFTAKLNPAEADPGVVSHSQFVSASDDAAAGLTRLLVPNAKTRIEAGRYLTQVVAIRAGSPNYIVTLDDQPILVKARLLQDLPS